MPEPLRRAASPILGVLALLAGAPAMAAECTPLTAVGGGTSVSKTIQLNGPLVFPFGRTNFNTDFTVSQNYGSYRVNFQSTSSRTGPYPIQAYLKFSDGTNLQVVNQTLTPAPGESRQFGPFYPPPGKLVTQVNVKVGTGYNANATGFSYTISALGCR